MGPEAKKGIQELVDERRRATWREDCLSSAIVTEVYGPIAWENWESPTETDELEMERRDQANTELKAMRPEVLDKLAQVVLPTEKYNDVVKRIENPPSLAESSRRFREAAQVCMTRIQSGGDPSSAFRQCIRDQRTIGQE